MDLTLRRLIALGFILIFILIAPALILYTAGYRYNFKKQEIQKTGALVIKSQPANAAISIDEKLTKYKTPARISNVMPGEHLISLSKTNYYSWNKKLNIKEQETAFAENIILFRKSEPEILEEQQIESIDFSPDGRFAIFVVNDKTQDYLYLLNLGNQKIRLIYNNGKQFDEPTARWSNNGAFLLFQDKTIATVISTFLPKQKLEVPISPSEITTSKLKWDENAGNRLYFSSGNDIFQFDVSADARQKIYSLAKTEKLLDYLIEENRIFTISELKGKFFLSRAAISQSADMLPRTIELSHGQFSLDGIIDGRPILYDLNNKDLYVFNADLAKIIFKKTNAAGIEYLPDKKLLLTETDQEINVINVNHEPFEEKNITRYSQGLTKTKWHYLANYVFALHEGKIDIIELDDRDGHFILSLPLNSISDFGIDEKSKYLFFARNGYLFQMLIK